MKKKIRRDFSFSANILKYCIQLSGNMTIYYFSKKKIDVVRIPFKRISSNATVPLKAFPT